MRRDGGADGALPGLRSSAASQPDPSRAAELGMTALTIAGQTGSARIIRELRTLERHLLARWPHHPGTLSFSEALTAA